MRGGKENHSTVSTVNTHISLTLSKSQRNKTKKVSKQNSINRKDKAQKSEGNAQAQTIGQQLRGLGSSTLGDRSCRNTGLHPKERSSKREVSWERCDIRGSLDGEVTQDSRHTAGAPWANHELPRLVLRQQPTPPCWELPLLPCPLVVSEAP